MGLIGVLDQPCPHCTGEAGDQMRAENRAAWEAWNNRESQGYSRFIESYRGLDGWRAWTATPECQALMAEQPEELPASGCVECDWTGVQVTDTGRELLAFLRRHGIRP